jgi:hypothetical protein
MLRRLTGWWERAVALKRVGLAFAVLGLVATLAVAIGVVFLWEDDALSPERPARRKVFSRAVAEGVRYRDCQTLGVDRLAFKSCRVEKRRSGAITFGAFNVLVVEDLVLNLPEAPPGGGAAAVPPDGWLASGLTETLLRSQGLGAGRFSGMRVDGLTVNRCTSNGLERVFAASRADSGLGGASLRLRACVVRAPDGSEAKVGEARLVLKPALALVYTASGAERRIDL